jgi:hypothetical protein
LYKSCDEIEVAHNNIDVLVVKLLQVNLVVCCMYCPPGTSITLIVSTIENCKNKFSKSLPFIVGGDFNVNLLDDVSSLDFISNLYTLSLHPVINLPTRVTDHSSTLIDNFFCDFTLLPTTSFVVKLDLSDHFLIAVSIDPLCIPKLIFKRSFSNRNKIRFSNKLAASDWTPLFLSNNVDVAFNYFLKKFKRIYNQCFPFVPQAMGTY